MRSMALLITFWACSGRVWARVSSPLTSARRLWFFSSASRRLVSLSIRACSAKSLYCAAQSLSCCCRALASSALRRARWVDACRAKVSRSLMVCWLLSISRRSSRVCCRIFLSGLALPSLLVSSLPDICFSRSPTPGREKPPIWACAMTGRKISRKRGRRRSITNKLQWVRGLSMCFAGKFAAFTAPCRDDYLRPSLGKLTKALQGAQQLFCLRRHLLLGNSYVHVYQH